MAAASELDKFILKHGPKLKKSGSKFVKDLSTAGHEAAEGVTHYAKAKAVDAGKAAVAEIGRRPLASAALSATAATALATGGKHDDLGDASEAGRKLRSRRGKSKRPYCSDDD